MEDSPVQKRAELVVDSDSLPTSTALAMSIRLDPAGSPVSPSPTTDALDPLNWPLWRKYVCIIIACYSYFLMTYLTTAPIPSFFLLEEQFDATYSETNWTFAISAFGLIFGPLLSGGLADIYGRRICLIVTTSVTLLASGCTSIHGQTISAYMFERFLQGLGAGSACNLGLSIINDVSFQHERGQRVGLWAIAANLGTFLGGVFGGFLVSINQYWVAYQVSIAYAVLLLLAVFALPETLYPRKPMLQLEFGTPGSMPGDAPSPRTRQLPFFVSHFFFGFLASLVVYSSFLSSLRSFSTLLSFPRFARISASLTAKNLRKIPGLTYPKIWSPWVVVFKLWAYPNIVISIMAYVYFQYWWIISLMTIEPLAYEDKSPQVQGLLFLGFAVGILFAEAFCSGHASDKLMIWLTCHSATGKRTPEMRLWLGYPAALLSALGLGLWGASVDQGWHWMLGQLAFFLYAVGLQVGNTVVTTYMVDNYPTYANELSIFYSCIINVSFLIFFSFALSLSHGPRQHR